MPLITIGTAEIMAMIAAEEAAAAAAATAATVAAEEAAATAASEAAAQAAAEQAASQAAQQGIMQAGTEQAATQAGTQGITQAAPLPPATTPPPATTLPPATTPPPAGPSAQLGLEQVVNPDQAMADELQRQMAQENANPTNFGPGRQYASVDSFDMVNNGVPQTVSDVPASSGNVAPSVNPNVPSGPTPPEAPYRPLFEPQQPASPFMKAYEYVDKMHPLSKGLGAYGLLSASGALNQKGASPPPQRTFNNPYHFSSDFQGTHPDPTMYQTKSNYPSYASGGITDLAMGGPAPTTNFANPAQSMMGTSQYSMATDPMSGNIAQRMADGGVTGSGQMQLNVPLSVGGGGDKPAGGGNGEPVGFGGSGSPYTPAGSGNTPPANGGDLFNNVQRGLGGKGNMTGPQVKPEESGLVSEVGRPDYEYYKQVGQQEFPRPQVAQRPLQQALIGPMQEPPPERQFQEPQVGAPVQRGLGGKGVAGSPQIAPMNNMGDGRQVSPMYDSTNSTSTADFNRYNPDAGMPMNERMSKLFGDYGMVNRDPAQSPLSGEQLMQAQSRGMASGGIAGIPSYRSGGKMDVYDASLRFADIMDNPSRYTPPDTRFQSVDTFRDTNPNTANKLADEAAETRRKAIEQRSYVNTGAKYLPPSRRPGQLDLGPVSGERSKYDNQESILAAQGGIMGYNLGGYANGGNPRLLKGPGDGMSDNIPATIADRQPARLADGEFVVPADVVSHLGNGSTEAGAKILHQMMDKVRVARTGNPKQGKKINPNKFMPKK
jgi:hypothetical protein